ncbi:MAG: CBS domain-containing protein [Alphaproteobacteria bacterium]
MTVATILQNKGRDVISLGPTATMAQVAKVLAKRKIGAVLVCQDGGELCGIISERDVVRAIGTDGAGVLDHPVSQHMTANVTTCTAADTIEQCMVLMTTGRFRHLPIMENGKLVGLVSIGDIVKERIAAAERESEEMRSYIGG